MNSSLNGVPVANWRNQPNHDIYNNLILSKLDEFNRINPNADLADANTFVNQLTSTVRSWVDNNPNLHLNELVLP